MIKHRSDPLIPISYIPNKNGNLWNVIQQTRLDHDILEKTGSFICTLMIIGYDTETHYCTIVFQEVKQAMLRCCVLQKYFG